MPTIIVGAELDEYSDDYNDSSKNSGELHVSMPSTVGADNESDASFNQVEKGENGEDSDDGESHQQTMAGAKQLPQSMLWKKGEGCTGAEAEIFLAAMKELACATATTDEPSKVHGREESILLRAKEADTATTDEPTDHLKVDYKKKPSEEEDPHIDDRKTPSESEPPSADADPPIDDRKKPIESEPPSAKFMQMGLDQQEDKVGGTGDTGGGNNNDETKKKREQKSTERVHKCRVNKHNKTQEEKLNGETPFIPKDITYLEHPDIIEGKVKPGDLHWHKGVLMSKEGEIKPYGKKDVIFDAAIMIPEGGCPTDRVIIQTCYIRHENPPLVTVKLGFQKVGTFAKRMTGACPRDGEKWVLVMYDTTDKELQWVPSHAVIDPASTNRHSQSQRVSRAGRHDLAKRVEGTVNLEYLEEMYEMSKLALKDMEKSEGIATRAVTHAQNNTSKTRIIKNPKVDNAESSDGQESTTERERPRNTLNVTVSARNVDRVKDLTSVSLHHNILEEQSGKILTLHRLFPDMSHVAGLWRLHENPLFRDTEGGDSQKTLRLLLYNEVNANMDSEILRAEKEPVKNTLCIKCKKNQRKRKGGYCEKCYFKVCPPGRNKVPYCKRNCIRCNKRRRRKKGGYCLKCFVPQQAKKCTSCLSQGRITLASVFGGKCRDCTQREYNNGSFNRVEGRGECSQCHVVKCNVAYRGRICQACYNKNRKLKARQEAEDEMGSNEPTSTKKIRKTAKTQEEEAAEKAQKKAKKDAKEITKRTELLPGFEQEMRENDAEDILKLSNERLREYIRYFFQHNVVNLSKKSKDELKGLLAPLLEEHYGSKAPAEASESVVDSPGDLYPEAEVYVSDGECC